MTNEKRKAFEAIRNALYVVRIAIDLDNLDDVPGWKELRADITDAIILADRVLGK